MLSIPGTLKIHLAVAPTDLRKSRGGLTALVEHALQADPFSDQWFVFRCVTVNVRPRRSPEWRWPENMRKSVGSGLSVGSHPCFLPAASCGVESHGRKFCGIVTV